MSQAATAPDPTFESDPRRIHVLFAGHTVADSTGAVVVCESGRSPVWYFPRRDVEMMFLSPTPKHGDSAAQGRVTYFTIYRDASVVENAAWSFEDPPPVFQAIAGYMAFDPAHFDLAIDGHTPAEWTADHASRPVPVAEAETVYASVRELADALRRASTAHERHEARTGAADPDWPGWYAAYMAAERTGQQFPS